MKSECSRDARGVDAVEGFAFMFMLSTCISLSEFYWIKKRRILTRFEIVSKCSVNRSKFGSCDVECEVCAADRLPHRILFSSWWIFSNEWILDEFRQSFCWTIPSIIIVVAEFTLFVTGNNFLTVYEVFYKNCTLILYVGNAVRLPACSQLSQ